MIIGCNMKMSSSLSKILETGINVFKSNSDIITKKPGRIEAKEITYTLYQEITE